MCIIEFDTAVSVYISTVMFMHENLFTDCSSNKGTKLISSLCYTSNFAHSNPREFVLKHKFDNQLSI